MHRRDFLRTTAFLPGLASGEAACRREEPTPPAATSISGTFQFEEATIADLQDGMAAGRFTAWSLVEAYAARIGSLDRQGPELRSIIEVNPDALAIADRLDRERKEGRIRGPLHGIPVLLKDNIDTNDRMTTTAGSLALSGSVPAQDGFVARRLRDAGAVLLGKANLSEWANIRSTHSSSGWSARDGQCRNPYVLDRNPWGSSSGSGVAVAANLIPVAIGTETDGSIVYPASANGVVGIKPTVGLVSRAGIIPISHGQDTAGPMARTVRDAALVLSVIAGPDPRDSASGNAAGRTADYAASLDPSGLQGIRIGVARSFFTFPASIERVLESALDAMRAHGAVLIDPVALALPDEAGTLELSVLLYELKSDLNTYLASLHPSLPVRSLADVIRFNDENRERGMPFFGQELFIQAQSKGPLTDAAYLRSLETIQRAARQDGIDAVMEAHRLDAIMTPTGGPAWVTDYVNGDPFGGGSSRLAAIAGYPNISVPAGDVLGLPVGLSFFGRPWSEPTLLRIAYAFEQATKHRRPPTYRPTLNG
jgi:amidase